VIDGYGSGGIGIEDGTEHETVVGEILDELREGAVFLDGHQLLKDVQGDC
jgi:hypothetical protein